MPISHTSEEVLITVATTAWSYTPASPLVTDEIIWLAFSVNASSGSITGPTDGSVWNYSNTQTLVASGSAAMVWAWHKVTAGENGTTPTYDFTGASTTLTIHALRIQGADPTNPINAFNERTDVDTTRTTPTMSSTIDGCSIYGGSSIQSAGSQSVNVPAAWAELQNSSLENAGRAHVLGYKGIQAVGGSIPTANFTSTSGLGGIVWQIAVAPAGGGSIQVGQATETDSSLSVARIKTRAVGQPAETDVSRSVARVKIRAVGQATELDTAASISNGSSHLVAVGRATETDVARVVVAAPGTAREPVFPATETDAAYSVAPRRYKAVGTASEASVARPISKVKICTIGRPAESDLARDVSPRSPGIIPIGRALEVDVATEFSWWSFASRGQITTRRRGRRATITTRPQSSIGDRE